MQARTKTVEVDGIEYELRRLPPEVGSFIFMRMLGAHMKVASEAKPSAAPPSAAPSETPAPPPEKVSGEMQVRALSFVVLSGGVGFEDFAFIQKACMKVVSRLEDRAGQKFAMPVMTDAGEWTKNGEDLAYSPGSVVKMTTESLVFCFSDFFDGPLGLGM